MVCSGRSLQCPTRTNRQRRTDEKSRPAALKARIAKRRPTQPLRVWHVMLAEIPSRAAAPAKLPLSTTSRRPACCRSGPLGSSIIEQNRIVYSIYKVLSHQFAESTLPRLRQRWKASYAHSSQIHGAGCGVFCRSRNRGMCRSAAPHSHRSVPATGLPNRCSSLRRCGVGARQCSTAGGLRLRTAASGPGLLRLFQHRGGTPPINCLKILSWLLALFG